MLLKWTLTTLLAAGVAAHAQTPALKDVFKEYFHIGAALNQAQFEERDARGAAIVQAQFNTITPENVLKWEARPSPSRCLRVRCRRTATWHSARSNSMFIVGHTLVWHSQVPAMGLPG